MGVKQGGLLQEERDLQQAGRGGNVRRQRRRALYLISLCSVWRLRYCREAWRQIVDRRLRTRCEQQRVSAKAARLAAGSAGRPPPAWRRPGCCPAVAQTLQTRFPRALLYFLTSKRSGLFYLIKKGGGRGGRGAGGQSAVNRASPAPSCPAAPAQACSSPGGHTSPHAASPSCSARREARKAEISAMCGMDLAQINRRIGASYTRRSSTACRCPHLLRGVAGGGGALGASLRALQRHNHAHALQGWRQAAA